VHYTPHVLCQAALSLKISLSMIFPLEADDDECLPRNNSGLNERHPIFQERSQSLLKCLNNFENPSTF
jgi:hypothetical protein